MAKKGKGSSGLLLAGLGLAAAFAVFRQGQATANTLTSARLTGFELKGWNGSTLSALAQVEFNNSNVSRDVQMQELGLSVTHEGTPLGSAHLKDGQVLAANTNTTLPIPVTVNIGSLLAKLAPKILLTGKVPSLKSLTSVSKVWTWLQENIAPETLRMQGTARVNGMVVNFDEPIPLSDYLPSNPRPASVDPLPASTTRSVVRVPGAPGVPASLPPVRLTPRTSAAAPTAKAPARVKKAGQLIKKGSAVLTQAASIVRTASGAVQTSGRPARRPGPGPPLARCAG